MPPLHGGGNISVIRASGSTGYNEYLLELADAASVETFRIDSRDRANHEPDNTVLAASEALFVAGGDQWNYTLFWGNTLLSATVRTLYTDRRVPFGGTSAGAMIWGGRYFEASGRSVTSQEALTDPMARDIALRPALFGTPEVLADRIIDTHFTQRNREGRLMTFLARAWQPDSGYFPKGIAIDERTAMIIDEDGIGTVYGAGFCVDVSSLLGQGRPGSTARGESAELESGWCSGAGLETGSRRPVRFCRRPLSGSTVNLPCQC